MKINSYNTKEFLEFSKYSNKNVINRYLFKYDEYKNSEFPIHLINKENLVLRRNIYAIATPILFCGPTRTDFLNNVFNSLDEDISSGFIQSRVKKSDLETNIDNKCYYYIVEVRNNYRVDLEIDNDNYFNTLKRDSKQRYKKIYTMNHKYNLIENSNCTKSIELFAELYKHNSLINKFPKTYIFNKEVWIKLLSADLWKLYSLFYENKLVSACVLAQVDDTYDYSFMAFNNDHKDASRALIFFLRNHLNSIGTKKYLYLGGGIRETDSLADFKKSVGGVAVPFSRIKFINKKIFNIECEEAEKLLKGRWP